LDRVQVIKGWLDKEGNKHEKYLTLLGLVKELLILKENYGNR